MHEQHNHCHHVFNICEACDTVYCTTCKREWRGHLAPHFTWYPSVPYYGTTTISCDNDTVYGSGSTDGLISDVSGATLTAAPICSHN